MRDRFQQAAEAVGATIKRFSRANEATDYLQRLAQGGIICSSPLPDEIRQALGDLPLRENPTPDVTLCVSFAEAGIAATGSLLLNVGAPDGRAATALAPLHAVFVREETIVPTLGDVGATLRERLMAEGPAYLSITTGPSRTADIERVLTIGVHGPKELHILIVEGA